MASPRLPEVEELVERLTAEIVDHPPADHPAWRVDGPATAGKSAMLRALAASLRERDLVPLLVAPPARAPDAGPLALIELAAGLKDAELVNGQTDVLMDGQVPLVDKVGLVRDWLAEYRDDIVVLYDEPAGWPDRSDQPGPFAEHARLVIDELVRDLGCRRVVTGDPPGAMRFLRSDRIGEASEGLQFLRSDAWGPVAEAAEDLAQVGGERLAGLSPLQLRLLVAHVAVSSPDEVASWLLVDRSSRRAISARLRDALSERPAFHDLLRAWRRLARIRRPFSEDLLLETVKDLSESSGQLLRHCLLFSVGDLYVLHETLRRDVIDADEDPAAFRDQLRALASYYRTSTLASPGGGLLSGMESLFYAARAGATELLDRPFFADQLDLLGKTLSYELCDFGGAADVFARATELDPNDDYAHHYLAYNLDLLGREAERVERHYRRAVELNSQHPWWQARLITFLVTRGRSAEARTAWDAALDELASADHTEGSRLYETLHGWVIETLLRRGQLDFAQAVAADIPQAARTESPKLTALIRRLRAQQLAETEGAFVPAELLRPRWWTQGPFLLQRRLGEDRPLLLRRWLAGRIEHIDPDGIEIRVRDVPIGSEETPPTASVRMALERFDVLSRDWPSSELSAGRFVEVGLYADDDGDQTIQMVRVHPERAWEDETLPPEAAPGDRYWLAGTAG